MEYELAGLRKGLQALGQTLDSNGRGGLCPVELHLAGVGGLMSRSDVESLVNRYANPGVSADYGPLRILLLGFAGALDPGLRTGDLVLSRRYYRAGPDRDDEDYLTPDQGMWQEALAAAEQAGLTVARVDSLTVDEVVNTPAAKAALRLRRPEGIVNMEDYPLALAARKAGVPFVSARAVLDVADQHLPGYLPGLAQSRTRAVMSAAAMPWRIPALWELGRQMRPAQQALTQFAQSYIQRQQRPGDGELSLAGAEPVEAASGKDSG